ncbi:MAG: adaptor protein MecA [Lachnospiraceae bacterium]|nr:adaptor protein MecA [Lachnospiraceae bacterium]
MREDEYETEISQKVGGIMKFRRIDEDTVRCIVSKEDMQEFGIVLEDFFKNKSKIHDFLHEVVERAEQEVGYEPKEGLLSMQIMPISQNSIAITFTEKEDGGYDDMINNIKETVADIISENEADDELQSDDVIEDFEDEIEVNDEKDDLVEENFTVGRDYRNMLDYPKIMVAMPTIQGLVDYCKAVNINKSIRSELYYLKNKDLYCLVIDKNRLSVNDFKTITRLAIEYSSNITNNKKIIAYVREQGEVIFDMSAYRFLTAYM